MKSLGMTILILMILSAIALTTTVNTFNLEKSQEELSVHYMVFDEQVDDYVKLIKETNKITEFGYSYKEIYGSDSPEVTTLGGEITLVPNGGDYLVNSTEPEHVFDSFNYTLPSAMLGITLVDDNNISLQAGIDLAYRVIPYVSYTHNVNVGDAILTQVTADTPIAFSDIEAVVVVNLKTKEFTIIKPKNSSTHYIFFYDPVSNLYKVTLYFKNADEILVQPSATASNFYLEYADVQHSDLLSPFTAQGVRDLTLLTQEQVLKIESDELPVITLKTKYITGIVLEVPTSDNKLGTLSTSIQF